MFHRITEFSLPYSRIPPDSIRNTAYVIYLHATITKVRCSEPFCIRTYIFSRYPEWYVHNLHLTQYSGYHKSCDNHLTA